MSSAKDSDTWTQEDLHDLEEGSLIMCVPTNYRVGIQFWVGTNDVQKYNYHIPKNMKEEQVYEKPLYFGTIGVYVGMTRIQKSLLGSDRRSKRQRRRGMQALSRRRPTFLFGGTRYILDAEQIRPVEMVPTEDLKHVKG